MTRGSTDGITQQARLIESLRNPAVHGAGVERVTVLETHISYVLLTGQHAYKIKKPVDLGFLDFTSLAGRRYYCEQELRLNRRLAPSIYLDVVAITGSLDHPVIGGSGPALEYAVKMREFPQDALLSRVLARGELTPAHIDMLAAKVAAFHRGVDTARADASFGFPEDILGFALQNFTQIGPLLDDASDRAALDTLDYWTRREHTIRAALLRQRRQDGFIRECHGDLHLGNIALVDGEITIFDCIEFNDRLRWIDVMSEVAFIVMDLQDRLRPDLANRLLNAYVETTGDYAGLPVLPFYLAYRAMVRAKVTCLRAAQLEPGEAKAALVAEYRAYVNLARDYALPPRPAIVITHGLAGCGKTTGSEALLELTGAIRVRTDVERKRLHGLSVEARSGSGIESGLYTAEATERTYRRALALARDIAAASRIAIVDATFLLRWQRDLFRQLAIDLDAPFAIVDFVASDATLRARIVDRARRGDDASEADLAVLDHQLRMQEPLAPDEQASAVAFDAEAPLERARDPSTWRAVFDRIGATQPEDPGVDAKVAFLSQPASYPEPTTRVDTIETHMSWVFLTDRHAYKLKKPVRNSQFDFRSVAARRLHCAEEVRLNRRFASDVYLGAVPMTQGAGRQLSLATGGPVVDWLVKMRRLPAERMLDHAIRSRGVRSEDVHIVVAALSRFYRECTPVALAPVAYRERFAQEIAANRRDLAVPDYGLPLDLIESVCVRQRAVLEREAARFDERVRAGRVVEGHGDLRPEHICLETPPQIIDCLVFPRDLRIVDAADELAFLALECERQGAPDLERIIFDTYGAITGDDPPATLVHFYQSYRASLRAKLAIWHLKEPALRDLPKWPALANDYLRLAREHIERCR